MRERPERPGGTAPHVLVADIASPELTADDRHHLERVRRLRQGDPLSVTDGRGAWRWCRLGAELVLDGEIECEPVPLPAITVAFALVKGAKPELVVQKLTELGVDRIVVFSAQRSVVRWDEAKVQHNSERLRRVAIEASMQSRRTWLPEIHMTADLSEVLAIPGMQPADRNGSAPSLASPAIMIGPEGGWSDSERSQFESTVALGSGVLRAETAAIAAGVLLSSLRDGLVSDQSGAGPGRP